MNRPSPAAALSFLLAVVLLTDSPASEAARRQDLGTWLNKDLLPYVSEQLTTHPRFKGELVRFVVFKNGNPAPTSDALAESLRNQLANSVIDVPGIRVGLSYTSANTNPDNAAIDCNQDAVHYYIGLEVSEAGKGKYKVELRALDLEDRNWVAGFAKAWRGALSKSERRAFRRTASDQSFRGQRTVPFSAAQPDLLAAYLARELGCALLRQVSGPYLVTLEHDDDQTTILHSVAELVSNNLAGYRALQVAADADRPNAILRGKAHFVDDGLFQYWITVAPTDASLELPPVAASAYVSLPGLTASHEDENTPPEDSATLPASLVAQSDADVLSSMRIVELQDAGVCSSSSIRFRDRIQSGSSLQGRADSCFALRVKTKEDAFVFFLNHQPNHGLVRLSGQDCRQRPEARIARENEALDYALPLRTLTRDALSPAPGWRLNPDADTYYAIAVSDSKAAWALLAQLEKLPRRCTISGQPGLKGLQLERWLADFAATVDQWQPDIDWQAIRVRNVF
jgi:hypothetical protein